MEVAVFSTREHDRKFLAAANATAGHKLVFFEPRLTPRSTRLAHGYRALCCFVNDQVSADVLADVAAHGTRMVALRCAGFNQVDLRAAADHGIKVARVPAYSPHAVAEHAVGMILALNRKFHRAYNRVREGNFSLDGLLGFDLHGKTAGVVGTGAIGSVLVKILHGFGCSILAHDVRRNPEVEAKGGQYVSVDELFSRADIISLHCPLTPDTRHLVNDRSLATMKSGVMLINTSRGGLIDASAAIRALKSGRLGYLGLDVYEEEADLFFEDLSGEVIQDDVFVRLMSFPNVLITGHQAFFTANALESIARQTIDNLSAFERGEPLKNEVTAELLKR